MNFIIYDRINDYNEKKKVKTIYINKKQKYIE